MAGICNLCGLPDELCICQEIAKEQQRVELQGRWSWVVRLADGWGISQIAEWFLKFGLVAKVDGLLASLLARTGSLARSAC